jgi:hypothetical protein
MLNQSTADAHPFVHILPEAPRDAHDPLPVMRREMKLLLIEMNLLRVEVEQLRAMDEEARKCRPGRCSGGAVATPSRRGGPLYPVPRIRHRSIEVTASALRRDPPRAACPGQASARLL